MRDICRTTASTDRIHYRRRHRFQTLAIATTQLSSDFPQVRAVNLLLQQQLTIDTYAEDVLTAAKLIIDRSRVNLSGIVSALNSPDL